ncbi:tripartite tricarboxylate transporter TctB family protein [Streptomyces qinglanensis]|uniref:tripartite tricarboxylate transporter TctB family protein n=1 Tax=Streptomyces qinglanensis TaxID=943816 RepID=UPI003D72D28F
MSNANGTRSPRLPRLPRSPRADRRDGTARTGSGAARRRGYSELGLCALLLAIGILVLSEALTMETVASARGPVGPRTVPLVVGTALLVVSVVLTVDVLRGATGGGTTRNSAAGHGAAGSDGAGSDGAGHGGAGPRETGGGSTLPEPRDAENPHPDPRNAETPQEAVRREPVSARAAQPDAVGAEEDEPGDWRTVALLAGVFLAFAALIEPLGFPLAGALLFWGSAFTLGSRRHALTRDPLIAAGLSLLTYTVFHLLLGVHLPGGPLMGVM